MDQQKITKHYKHIIVGGGIVGAGIFRDLCLHQENVLLIDKGDFASQTSQGSSKMLHGGIRYLENFDFALVHEALREKKIWLKLASHIAKEDKFYLPVYRHSKWPLFLLRIGLFLYDLLSFFRNPPYKILNKKQTIKGLPGIKEEGLKGAGLYSDGIINDSKLVLDLIFDSIQKGGKAINYHEIVSFTQRAEQKEVILKDTLKNEIMTLTCDNLICAVGPFTDQLMRRLKVPWEDILLPSKGAHLWLNKTSLPLEHAMVLQTKDNRIIFVIPQRNAILVGTTELPVSSDEDIFNLKATAEEITYLLNTLNEYFPHAQVTQKNILATTAAVRPLVKSSWSKNRGKTSRNHKIYNPQSGIYVIAGGKYTTFRVMSQDLCRLLFKKLNQKYNKQLSLTPLEKVSAVYDIHGQKINKELLTQIIQTEMPKTMEDLLQRRLCLYSLEQANNSDEIKELIAQVKEQLPSI